MSWIYEKRHIKSEKNGTIKVTRLFGHWEVSVNGFFESGRYMQHLWKNALKRLPPDFTPKNILILGLGAGSLNSLCRERYPDAHIIAVEWDAKMIEIAQRLQITDLENTQIINDEAYSAIQKINDQFDLIFFDLYFGSKAGAWHEAFFERLSALLSSQGFFAANVFAQKEKFEYIEKHFQKLEEWKHKYNNVGIFKKTL